MRGGRLFLQNRKEREKLLELGNFFLFVIMNTHHGFVFPMTQQQQRNERREIEDPPGKDEVREKG